MSQAPESVTEPDSTDSETVETRGDERVELLRADTNNDGKTDVWVVDTDGDGKADLFQFDTDGDGKVDITMVDIDEDGTAGRGGRRRRRPPARAASPDRPGLICRGAPPSDEGPLSGQSPQAQGGEVVGGVAVVHVGQPPGAAVDQLGELVRRADQVVEPFGAQLPVAQPQPQLPAQPAPAPVALVVAGVHRVGGAVRVGAVRDDLRPGSGQRGERGQERRVPAPAPRTARGCCRAAGTCRTAGRRRRGRRRCRAPVAYAAAPAHPQRARARCPAR